MIRLVPLPTGALTGCLMWAAECDHCGRRADSLGERARDAAEFAGLDGWTIELSAHGLESWAGATVLCPDCTLSAIGPVPE